MKEEHWFESVMLKPESMMDFEDGFSITLEGEEIQIEFECNYKTFPLKTLEDFIKTHREEINRRKAEGIITCQEG